MGGARPKAVVEDDGSLWIAKFERKTDTFDQCGSEHATMRLAARCGIDVAETRLVEVGPRRAVLVKRFDRSSGPRFTSTVHFLSSLSLLNGDETSAEGSYSRSLPKSYVTVRAPTKTWSYFADGLQRPLRQPRRPPHDGQMFAANRYAVPKSG
jgi:HipA-like C-terminal domain